MTGFKSVVGLFALGLCFAPAPVRSAEPVTFKHPAGAYTLPVPSGWHTQTFIDNMGYPFHFFGPEKAKNLDAIGPGLCVYAVPIPPGFRPTAASSEPFVTLLVTMTQWQLEVESKNGGPAKIGPFAGTARPVKSNLNDPLILIPVDNERGELRFALSDSYLFVTVAWGYKEYTPDRTIEWKAIRERSDAALAGLKPVRAEPFTRERPKAAEKLEDAADRVKPSVPRVRPAWRDDPGTAELAKMHLRGWGSGVVVTDTGYVLTNRHVVEHGVAKKNGAVVGTRFTYDPVQLEWHPGTKLDPAIADVVAVSYSWDLALLKIRGSKKWVPVPFADPARPREGQKVMVAGWPDLGRARPSFYVNEGALTALEYHPADRRPERFVHSARTNNGNSGGLLYDLDLGGLIGIHYQGVVTDAKGFEETIGHAAVPLARVFEEFPQLEPGAAGAFTADERLVRVATFYHARRHAGALAEAERLRSANPKSGAARAFEMRALLAQGEPESVIKPLFEAAAADPLTKRTAALWRARGLIEAADWTALGPLVRDVILKGDGGPGTSGLIQLLGPGNFAGLSLIEARTVAGYADGSFEWLRVLSKLSTQGSTAEAEVLLAAHELRTWLLENKVTALPAQAKPGADLVKRIDDRLEKGTTLWPAHHELALIYRAVLYAAAGRADDAQRAYTRALAGGRRDRLFLTHVAYYDLLTDRPITAYRRAVQIARADSPGTTWLLGWSLTRLADVFGKLDPAKKVEVEAGTTFLNELKRDGSIPDGTELKDAADACKKAGAELTDLALVRIGRDDKAVVPPDLLTRQKKLPLGPFPDNWWGPFVYLHHDRVWQNK